MTACPPWAPDPRRLTLDPAQDEAAAEQKRIAAWLRSQHPELADAVLRGKHWTT